MPPGVPIGVLGVAGAKVGIVVPAVFNEVEGLTRLAPVVSVTSVYSIAHVIPVSRTVLLPALPTEVGSVVRRRGSDEVVSHIMCPVMGLKVDNRLVFDRV